MQSASLTNQMETFLSITCIPGIPGADKIISGLLCPCLYSLYSCKYLLYQHAVAYAGIFFGGGSTNSVEDRDRGQRKRGSWGGSLLVRGSGGSCNLVQEISFHMVTFSSFLVL